MIETEMKGLGRSVYYNTLKTRLLMSKTQDIVAHGRNFYSKRV